MAPVRWSHLRWKCSFIGMDVCQLSSDGCSAAAPKPAVLEPLTAGPQLLGLRLDYCFGLEMAMPSSLPGPMPHGPILPRLPWAREGLPHSICSALTSCWFGHYLNIGVSVDTVRTRKLRSLPQAMQPNWTVRVQALGQASAACGPWTGCLTSLILGLLTCGGGGI